MITIAACAVPFAVLAGCGAYSWSVLHGHRPRAGRLACLRRALAIRALIVTTLALIVAVRVARAALHPARYGRYLTTRAIRRIPRRDPDGEPLDAGEARDFISICRGWKHAAPERTPHP